MRVLIHQSAPAPAVNSPIVIDICTRSAVIVAAPYDLESLSLIRPRRDLIPTPFLFPGFVILEGGGEVDNDFTIDLL